MNNQQKEFDGYFPTWCPGCGNFGIWGSLKRAFNNLGFSRGGVVVVYGIGCSGNMNDFLWVSSFHGLHGRAIPSAVGIKIANHNLPVVVVVGDGDCYGEGGNHFVHSARGNHDITVIVHDNRVYGLTTGQVAPTALQWFKSKSTPSGMIEVPFNPIALAISSGATFVSQAFAGDVDYLSKLIAEAIKHKGFSLVNILQPCVTFNKVTTYAWYRERIYKLDHKNHDSSDKEKAMILSMRPIEKIPVGIIYKETRSTYTDNLPQLKDKILAESNLEINIDRFASEFI